KRLFARGRINEWDCRCRDDGKAKQAARATLFLLIGFRRMPGATAGHLLGLCLGAATCLPGLGNASLRRNYREGDRAREQKGNDNVERRSHAASAYATEGQLVNSRGVTIKKNFSLPRITITGEATPISEATSRLCRSSMVAIGWPLKPTTMSLSRRPAMAAGLWRLISVTCTPVFTTKLWKRTRRGCSGTFCPAKPIELRRIRPSRINQPATKWAVLLAIAKQIPCAGRITAVLTPTTSPALFNKWPPE